MVLRSSARVAAALYQPPTVMAAWAVESDLPDDGWSKKKKIIIIIQKTERKKGKKKVSMVARAFL